MQTSTLDKKSISVLEGEVKNLQTLINNRDVWLNNPVNKMKGTYGVVASDTAKQRAELEEKKKELKELKNQQI